MDDFECMGIWWIPGLESRKVTGTLRFSKGDGATLSLLGTLLEFPGIFQNAARPSIILGLSSDGKQITLYESYHLTGNLSSGGFPTESYRSTVVFVGVHFASIDYVKFRSISIRCRHLNEWADLGGFTISEPSPRSQVTIKYKTPKTITANIGEDFILLILAVARGPTHFRSQNEVQIYQNVYFQVTARTRKESSFEAMLNLAAKARDLLTFSVGTPADYIDVIGMTRRASTTFGEKTVRRPVQIYFRPVGDGGESRRLSFHDMLFSLADFRDRFEQTIKSWYSKAEQLEPVYNLYFATRYNPHAYLETRFLNMIQALETYHRRMVRTIAIPTSLYRTGKRAILRAVPIEYRKWLTDRLAYGNEPSLYVRLLDLIDLASPTASMFISDAAYFARKVTDTRNYNTHFSGSLQSQAIHGESLDWVTERLRFLLEGCLLREIGFSDVEIQRMIGRKYGQEIDLANSHPY